MRVLIAFLLLMTLPCYATNTCSRTAIINGQKVLVDTNYSERGEGLRFHLEKDPIAEKYLNKYQEGTKINWANTALGTIGTILIISGILNSSDETKRNKLLIGGASLMTVNFFLYKTLENSNEKNLRRSIHEYNKRNSPKIFFDNENRESPSTDLTIGLSKTWSF